MKQTIVQSATKAFDTVFLEFPDLTTGAKIEWFIAEAYSVPDFSHYKIFSETSVAYVKDIEAAHGDRGVKTFLRLALLKAVLKTVEAERIDALPERLKRNHYIQLLRISQCSDTRDEWLKPGHDVFQKEFGLATLRLYAAGCQLIDVRCGLPRSMLLKQGVLGVAGLCWKILQLGGFKPLFQIHLHTLTLDNFNEAAREECYLCCVELYALYPDALGMFGASWFYDPALAEISPHLAYLRTVPEKSGAFVIFVNESEDARNNALQKSKTRQRSYDEGNYIPRHYMLVWPKKGQIKWASDKQ